MSTLRWRLIAFALLSGLCGLSRLTISSALAQLTAPVPVSAQQTRLPAPPDSLRAVLRGATTTAARATALLRVAWAFEGDGETPDSAGMLGYAAAAEGLGRRLGDSAVVGEAYDVRGAYWLGVYDVTRAALWLRRADVLLADATPLVRARHLHHYAYYYEAQNQNMRAIACDWQAIRLYGLAHVPKEQARLLIEIGSDYQRENRPDSAISCLFRALKLTRRLRDREQEASALSNIGAVYFMKEDYATADRYARATYRVAVAAHDTATMAAALEGLAVSASDRDSTALSLRYLRRLQQLIRRLPHYDGQISVLTHFGRTFRVLHQLDSAASYYERAKVLGEQQHEPDRMYGLTLTALSEIRYRQGRATEATALARQALSLDTTAAHGYVANALHTLRVLAVDRHDYPAAYALLLREQAVNTRSQARQNTRQMEEVRAGYEVDEAEQQVRLLTEQRTVAQLRQQRTTAGLSALALLAVAGAGLGARTYRRRQRTRESGLRTQLAADLHDDVGALLTQITLETSLLQVTGPRQPEQLLAQLERLTDISRRSKQQMTDVVWSIDARRDSMDELLTRMRDHAFETLPTAGLDFDFHADPALSAAPLALATRQHLYLIYKEALHNVVKHAHATVVTVRLTRDAHALVLHLTDNGHGYTGTGRAGGQGLANMRARAEASGGTLTIDAPVPGQGFGLTLRLPV